MTNTSFIGQESSIKVHDELTPYMGYKVIGILNPEGDTPLKMFGPHYNSKDHYYENMTPSFCTKSCKNFEKCSCGFYAYESYKKTFSHWVHESNAIRSFYIAKVAFSGTTVICENGARASIQRVVKLYIPCCWNCDNTAQTFIKHSGGSLSPACQPCVDGLGDIDADALVSFDALSKCFSVTGFNPVEIIPIPMGKFEKVIGNREKKIEMLNMMRELAEDGEVEMISSIGQAAFGYSVDVDNL